MNLTKEQLLNIKDLLKTLNEKIPKKTKNSLLLASTINVTGVIFCIYSLITTDIEVQTIIKSLLASGVTTGIITIFILSYIENYKKELEEENEKIINKENTYEKIKK